MRQMGFRAAPGLRYLQVVPPFTEHYFDSDGPDPSLDNGPTGGLAWDGRVDRGRDQARIPLLSSYEMACEDTLLQGSRLVVEEVPVLIFCRQCDAQRPLHSVQLFCCSECGTPTGEIVQGKELVVVGLEVEE